MNAKNKNLILFVFVVFSLLLKANLGFALEAQYPPLFGMSLDENSQLNDLLCYIIGAITTITISLTAIVIALGGLYYIISYSKGSFLNEAKEWIKAGITGLLIVVCSSAILYTINPALLSCSMSPFAKILIDIAGNFTDLSSPVATQTTPVVTYKEIPIGTLAENLLTRTMDCYDFDFNGDPLVVERNVSGGSKIKLPTFLDHDRAECFALLVAGAQKKAKVAADLSKKITYLTGHCVCENKCNPTCGSNGCNVISRCPAPGGNGKCGGACVNGSCNQIGPATDCCPDGMKNKIEHGPINPYTTDDIPNGSIARFDSFLRPLIGWGPTTNQASTCEATNNKEYNGLDEFRCPNPKERGTPCENIISHVEGITNVNGREVKIIDKTKWNKLNLYQQITYFKEKINELQELIQKDKQALIEASKELNTCYLAIPSIDLIRNIEATPYSSRLILVNKTFEDPITENLIDSSKYCTGFGYKNSSCFENCNNSCPDTSQQAMSNFSTGDCRQCKVGDGDYDSCINKQQECVINAFKAKLCVNGENSSQKLKDCLNSCQDKCQENCAKKYLACSNEFNSCKSQCINNGQCLLDNPLTCLLNPQSFVACAENSPDQGNAEKCFNDAYLCKNGSDEFAGYQDCANPKNCSSNNDETSCNNTYGCKWSVMDEKCLQKFSSGFLSQNPGLQKCPNPSSTAQNSSNSCLSLHPETAKCPSNSSCPSCVCDSINTPVNFLMPQEAEKNDIQYLRREYALSEPHLSGTSYQTFPEYSYKRDISVLSKPTNFSQQTSGRCTQYLYNGDPLTFYCMNEWFNDPLREGYTPKPAGSERVCSKSSQIPVGTMVNDAENWADKISYYSTDLQLSLQDILDKIKIAGRAKDVPLSSGYCSCSAKNRCGTLICKSDCFYTQTWDAATGWFCRCSVDSCKGDPCQQLTDYLAEIWNNYGNFMTKYINIHLDLLEDPKSDIIKELIYSRKMTNKCSIQNTAFGPEHRMLNCTRVKDELLTPASENCFGQDMQDTYDVTNCMPVKAVTAPLGSTANPDKYCGTAPSTPTGVIPNNLASVLGGNQPVVNEQEPTCYENTLIDDWYCCEEYGKEPMENRNPIYNIKN